jgi:hypothetical protein
MDSLNQRGNSFSQRVGESALDVHRTPLRHRNQLRNTALRAGKKPGLNSDLLQEAEGESDHLPETISNCLLG